MSIEKIEIPQEELAVFPGLDKSFTCSSTTMNKWFKKIIAGVFKDFAGFRPNLDLRTGRYTLQACFEQKDFAEGDVVAFKHNLVDKGSAGVDRLMGINELMYSGNHFSITDDAKNAFKSLMAREAKNADGTVRWDTSEVISQLADPNMLYTGKQYNVINLVDPEALLELMFGNKAKVFVETDDGVKTEYHTVKYQIEVRGPKAKAVTPAWQVNSLNPTLAPQMNTMIINDTLILRVIQIDGDVLADVAQDVGVQYQNNLGIDE